MTCLGRTRFVLCVVALALVAGWSTAGAANAADYILRINGYQLTKWHSKFADTCGFSIEHNGTQNIDIDRENLVRMSTRPKAPNAWFSPFAVPGQSQARSSRSPSRGRERHAVSGGKPVRMRGGRPSRRLR